MNDAAAFATKCLQLLQYLATHEPDSAAARRVLMGAGGEGSGYWPVSHPAGVGFLTSDRFRLIPI